MKKRDWWEQFFWHLFTDVSVEKITNALALGFSLFALLYIIGHIVLSLTR